jgi:hypothetical protein
MRRRRMGCVLRILRWLWWRLWRSVLCTGRTTQAQGCPGLFGRPGLVTVLAAPIFIIQPTIERAIFETVPQIFDTFACWEH